MTMKNSNLKLATVVTGFALAVSQPGIAHDGHNHAGHGTMVAMQHVHEGAAGPSAGGGYKRSVKTYTVPDVTLLDQQGKPVRLRDTLATSEPVMLNFIFTTCTSICPTMSAIFEHVPTELGAEAGRLRMISISIDPENDTPPQLDSYARKFHAGPRWQFLTGSVENVVAVQRAFDNYKGDKMKHDALTLLRPSAGRPWVRIEGFATPVELAREYRGAVLQ
jgi:protein SCO1/2